MARLVVLGRPFGYKVGAMWAHVQSCGRSGRSLRRALGWLLVMVAGAACSLIQPHANERLAGLTAEVTLSPVLERRALTYQDACGARREVALGPAVRDALVEEAAQLFARVERGTEGPGGARPDRRLDLALDVAELVLFIVPGDARAYPATVTLAGPVALYDAQGRLLEQHRLRAEVTGTVRAATNECSVDGVARLAREAVDTLAEDFGAYLRSSTPLVSATVAPEAMSGAPVALSFRARLSDENGDQVLEGGEQVTLDVEVTNIGHAPARDVRALVSGSAELLAALPRAIPFGDLAPGESRLESVTGRVGVVGEDGELELLLTVESRTVLAVAPARKKFLVTVEPKHRT